MKLHIARRARLFASDGLHRHEELPNSHELHCCLSGQGRFRLDDAVHPFGPGTATLAGPGEMHGVEVSGPDAPVTFVYIIVDSGAECCQVLNGVIERFARHPALAMPPYAEEFLRSLIDHQQAGGVRRTCAERLAEAFVAELAQSPPVAARLHPAVEKAVRIMESRLGQPFDLAAIAAEAGLNKDYLSRLFNQQMGLPPQRFFLQQKVEASCYLLQDKTVTMAKVAEQLGFYDEYHFSRTFKSFMGTCPLNFRGGEGNRRHVKSS